MDTADVSQQTPQTLSLNGKRMTPNTGRLNRWLNVIVKFNQIGYQRLSRQLVKQRSLLCEPLTL